MNCIFATSSMEQEGAEKPLCFPAVSSPFCPSQRAAGWFLQAPLTHQQALSSKIPPHILLAQLLPSCIVSLALPGPHLYFLRIAARLKRSGSCPITLCIPPALCWMGGERLLQASNCLCAECNQIHSLFLTLIEVFQQISLLNVFLSTRWNE